MVFRHEGAYRRRDRLIREDDMAVHGDKSISFVVALRSHKEQDDPAAPWRRLKPIKSFEWPSSQAAM